MKMKYFKLLFITILTVLLLGLNSWSSGHVIILEIKSSIEWNSKSAGDHVPIYIDGNEALATFIGDEGLSGNGSYIFPYIIENFIIEASTAHGIEIQSTDAYLIIRDCTVEGGKDGIHLYNVANVNISNNVLSNNQKGIVLASSSTNTLSGNTANNNEYGIWLEYSHNNTFLGNNANNNINGGIGLYGSSNNTLTGNNVSYNSYGGISLRSSSTNTFLGNTANNNECGIDLTDSSTNTLSRNNVSYNSYDGISLSNSSNNTFLGNTANNNDCGIDLSDSSTNTLSGNNVSYNSYDGISLRSSSTNTLSENTINNNDRGIDLSDSSTNTLSGNTVSYNSYDGISLSSSSNNTFTGNTVNNNDCGIDLAYSSTNTLSENIMNGSGLMFYKSYDNNIDTSNKVNDHSVRYYENTPGVYLSGESDVGQVILVNCDDSIIEGLYFSETSVGIAVHDSVNCSISENTIIHCKDGISLYFSSTNTLSRNTASNNTGDGISLYSSSNNTLTGNTASYNANYGISLYYSSHTNIIYFNDIYGNTNSQAYEDTHCTDNQWDNGIIGNYWGEEYISNYPSATNDGTFWSIPYEISGDGNGIDQYPLVYSITTYETTPTKTPSGNVLLLLLSLIVMLTMRQRNKKS
jgi:parallel beta-helix repeat protein